MNSQITSRIQELKHEKSADVQLFMKREDEIHPFVSGNKFRKLKYNLLEAECKGLKTLLTFGGAFSNHIAAVACAGAMYGFETVGVIRGEELAQKTASNPTLYYAKSQGMELYFVSREDYRKKEHVIPNLNITEHPSDIYVLPEGGTNNLAVRGCEEILNDNDKIYDYICCSVGTGGTVSGLINASIQHQQVLGFSALKGDFLTQDICKFANKSNWRLITDYHFGGYAKINDRLIRFMNGFKANHGITLDPIYTGKMVYGVFDLLEKRFFPKGSKVLMIHTGGLQGIDGMNILLKLKQKPQINV